MKPYILLLFLTLTGCTLDEQVLYGNWRATAFYKDGQPAELPRDSVTLDFYPEGSYRFSSIGFYRETGSFRISMHYLLLTDTSAHPSQDHILKVLFLSEDTLKLRMERAGQEQQLIFVKTVPIDSSQ